MFGSTMLLTIGQALDRAKDDQLAVRMHVGGDWITGRVLNSDGHGVAVLEDNGDLCVVRQDTITCVRLPSRTNDPFVAPQPQEPQKAQEAQHDRHVPEQSTRALQHSASPAYA